MSNSRTPAVEYLGDGVQVTSDGWQLVLEGNANGRENVVYLELAAFKRLLKYAEAAFGLKIAIQKEES